MHADYLSRKSLAARLELKETDIEIMVRKGILPPPVDVGGKIRWRWRDVDDRIMARALGTADADASNTDPFDRGATDAAQAAAARVPRHKPDGATVSVLPIAPRDSRR